MAECPVTGRLLPAGFVVHPDCAERFQRIGRCLVSGLPLDAEAVRDKEVSPGRGDSAGSVAGPRLLIRPQVFYPVEEAEDTLRVWAFAAFQFVRPQFRPDIYRLAWETLGRFFIRYSLELCRWVDAARALDECEDALKRCFQVVDPADAQKVIRCPNCLRSWYYTFNLDHLVCRYCQAVVDRRKVEAQMKALALEELVSLQVAVELVRELGYALPDGTVKTWVRRGKLILHSGRRVRANDIIALLDKVKP